MAQRSSLQIVAEARDKITVPMPVNRIMTRLGIGYSTLKRLIRIGVLKYVDSKKQDGGSPPKRYIAVDETKLRTNPNE